MNRIILIFILFVSSLSMNAQLIYAPSDATIEGYTSETDILVNLDLTLTNIESAEYYWKLVKTSEFKDEWSTLVCDANVCYPPNSDECSPTKGNPMVMDQTTHWSVHILCGGVAGEDELHLKIYDNPELTNEILDIPIIVNILPPSGIEITEKFDLKLYPNPTVSTFKVSDDKNVASIAIFNIVGKQMLKENHFQGQSHDVSNLQNGMYLVRFLDKKDEMLKVVRLTKK